MANPIGGKFVVDFTDWEEKPGEMAEVGTVHIRLGIMKN